MKKMITWYQVRFASGWIEKAIITHYLSSTSMFQSLLSHKGNIVIGMNYNQSHIRFRAWINAMWCHLISSASCFSWWYLLYFGINKKKGYNKRAHEMISIRVVNFGGIKIKVNAYWSREQERTRLGLINDFEQVIPHRSSHYKVCSKDLY
jgi:hypothetical protein